MVTNPGGAILKSPVIGRIKLSILRKLLELNFGIARANILGKSDARNIYGAKCIGLHAAHESSFRSACLVTAATRITFPWEKYVHEISSV